MSTRAVKPNITDCLHLDSKPNGYVQIPEGAQSYIAHINCPFLNKYVEILVDEKSGKGICVNKECQTKI